MNFHESIYYFVVNSIFLIPIFFMLPYKQVALLPAVFYLFFSWVFLVLGIPFSKNVTVLGGYSFSYSFTYIIVMVMIASPAVLYFYIINKQCDKNEYLSSLSNDGAVLFYYCLWGFSFLGVVAYFIINGLPPLFGALSMFGSSAALYALRMDITYGSGYRFFDVFFILIPSISTLIGAYLFKKNNLTRTHFLLSVIVCLILSFSFLQKSHMIIFVLSLSLMFYFFSKKNIINFILFPLLSSVGLLLITYIFYIGTVSYGYHDLLVMIFDRITIPYVVTLDFILENFDNSIPLLMGRSFPNPKEIFDFEPVYLSNFMMNMLAGKTEGTVPAPSAGFLYANFGFLGVLFNSILVFGYFLLLYWVFKNFRSPVGFAIWTYLTVSVYNFSVRDPFGILDIWVFVILFLSLLWKTFFNVHKKNS